MIGSAERTALPGDKGGGTARAWPGKVVPRSTVHRKGSDCPIRYKTTSGEKERGVGHRSGGSARSARCAHLCTVPPDHPPTRNPPSHRTPDHGLSLVSLLYARPVCTRRLGYANHPRKLGLVGARPPPGAGKANTAPGRNIPRLRTGENTS